MCSLKGLQNDDRSAPKTEERVIANLSIFTKSL